MAIAKYEIPTCPTDCGNIDNLPDTSMETCVEAMGLFESEIDEIYITIPDANGDAPNEIATWDASGITTWYNANVGNAADAKDIRRLVVVGDYDNDETEGITVSKRRTKTGTLSHVLNFTIDDLNDTNREMVRKLQCGATVVMWFKTIGGNFFGGVKGIQCDISQMKLPLARGEGNFEVATGQMSWERAAAPPRIAFPL